MVLRVAIFGFGKVGRSVFRALYRRPDIDVVAINDLAPAEAMAYLLRFDSLRGRFEEPVRVYDDHLIAGGQRIPILHQRDPGDVPWYDYGVDVVIDASGSYRTRAELQRHLDAGADRVILTTPPRGEIDAIYINCLEEEPPSRQARIISCGSSTANCTALMVQVLHKAFGVESGFFTSVHAYTAEQNLIDVPSSVDLRLSRAAVENIVPVHSWTGEAIQRFFPHLRGRFQGHKLNVPVPDVSSIDLVATLESDVDPQMINEVFRSASNSTMQGLLEYTEEPIVSTDVAGNSATCVFDSQTTLVVDQRLVKVLGWYDQGGGLSQRIVDLLAELGPKASRSARDGGAS